MQVKPYMIYAIFGILFVAGSIAMVATHDTYQCENDTSDDITDGCQHTDLIDFQSNYCLGAVTYDLPTYGVDIICPWSGYVTIISYISLALSLIFFITAATDLFKHPLVACITILSGLLGGILLLVTWISMIVDQVQGGGGYDEIDYTNGDSSSDWVFVGNTILVFLTFDLLGYTIKTMPDFAKKKNAAPSSNTVNLLGNQQTNVKSTKAAPKKANIAANQANKAAPKQMPGV